MVTRKLPYTHTYVAYLVFCITKHCTLKLTFISVSNIEHRLKSFNFKIMLPIVCLQEETNKFVFEFAKTESIVDSVLANSKTQNAFLFTVHASFRHDYPLAVEPSSTPGPLVQKKNFERFSTYLYAPFCCVFLGCCTVESGSSRGTYE
jgi:hypothetical protein